MKAIFKTIIIAGTVAFAVSGMALAQSTQQSTQQATEQSTETSKKPGEHKFEKAAKYYAECKGATVKDFEKIREQVRAFTDIKIMAETVNDPEKFFALLGVVNDPHTIHVMASCATEPVMWDTWMKGGTDPQNWMAAMAGLMNPAGMMKWMMAPMNPKIWQQMMSHGDPSRYAKWSIALMNPAFYKPATNMTQAEWYDSRVKWLSNPESFAPILEHDDDGRVSDQTGVTWRGTKAVKGWRWALIMRLEGLYSEEILEREIAIGMPDLRPVVIDHPVSSITDEEVVRRVATITVQAQEIWLGTRDDI